MKLRVESWHGGQLVLVLATASVVEWVALGALRDWGGLSEIVGVSLEDTLVIGSSSLVIVATGLFAWIVTWKWFGSRRNDRRG